MHFLKVLVPKIKELILNIKFETFSIRCQSWRIQVCRQSIISINWKVFHQKQKYFGIWSIGVPAHKLDEDLLKCLDLVHGIGQAEKAGFGSANIFALLVDYPPGSCKMKIRSDMRILLFFALMPIQMFVPLQHKTHLSQWQMLNACSTVFWIEANAIFCRWWSLASNYVPRSPPAMSISMRLTP